MRDRRAVLGSGAAVGAALALQVAPTLTGVPQLRRRLWPRLTGLGRPEHVALTFDDGPDPVSTPFFLDVLAGLEVKATFFVLGSMLRRAPDLARRTVAEGHELAVHSWDHVSMLRRSPAAAVDELTRTASEITEVTGEQPRWFRPPYGIVSGSALRAARVTGLQTVLWSSWGRDWEPTATPLTVQRTVSGDLAGGGTVLLHDSDCTSAPGSWNSALGALPALVDRWRDAGWQVGPLREHFAPA